MVTELNKKLAEWAGFKYGRFDFVSSLSSELNFIDTGWLSPVAIKEPYSSKDFLRELPDFPNSLDACLKWLVPKLNHIELNTGMMNKRGKCLVRVWKNMLQHYEVTSTTPALALCLAIEKLIDNE